MGHNVIELSDRVVAAYNAKDFATLKKLLHPKLDFAHANRGFAFGDAAALIGVLETFAGSLMPDRRMSAPERVVAGDGGVVVRVATWGGTAKADIPGIGPAGPISITICSVLRFDDAGLLVEWKDYG